MTPAPRDDQESVIHRNSDAASGAAHVAGARPAARELPVAGLTGSEAASGQAAESEASTATQAGGVRKLSARDALAVDAANDPQGRVDDLLEKGRRIDASPAAQPCAGRLYAREHLLRDITGATAVIGADLDQSGMLPDLDIHTAIAVGVARALDALEYAGHPDISSPEGVREWETVADECLTASEIRRTCVHVWAAQSFENEMACLAAARGSLAGSSDELYL